ncbi:MAG: glycosyltransferase [Brevinematales bacterium]|nr:glycosyltransferase [Brevinematales bacterium]
MARMSKIFSFIIPTLNSEKTLRLCLSSIVNQTFDKDKIEIIVVDGGSKDKTIELAKDYGALVLDNPMVQPEYAKYNIGIPNARGDFIIFLDSDEVLGNLNTLSERYKIISNYPYIKLILFSGYITPNNSHPINYYVNSVGDPFAFFIYSNEKSFGKFYEMSRKFYNRVEHESFMVLDKSKLRKKTLLLDFASSITIDRNILTTIINNLDTRPNFSEVFYRYLETSYEVCLPKNQPVVHYSSDSIKRYLSKIQWKININLLFNEKGNSNYVPAGFAKREKTLTFFERLKKYLFIPYSISVILPLLDGIRLSIRHKNLHFILFHTFFSIYTSLSIFVKILMKLFGVKPMLKPYGK